MAEKMGRLSFIKGVGGLLAVTAGIGGVSQVQADSEVVLDSKVFMFHFERGMGIKNIVLQMKSEGRINILPTDLGKALYNKISLPPSYVLTVDDGYAGAMDILDIAAQLGVRVAFYVMGRWNGDGIHRYITDQDKKQIADSGHEIGCHTDNHPRNLTELFMTNRGAYNQEVDGSRKYLQDLTGQAVNTFAYPYGVFNQVVAEDLAQHYQLAFTTQAGNFHRLSQSAQLPRLSIN